jgi:hypothetical protein
MDLPEKNDVGTWNGLIWCRIEKIGVNNPSGCTK